VESEGSPSEGSGAGARALDLVFLDGFWSEILEEGSLDDLGAGSLDNLGAETRREAGFEAPGVLVEVA
jgi:hypothetical protein